MKGTVVLNVGGCVHQVNQGGNIHLHALLELQTKVPEDYAKIAQSRGHKGQKGLAGWSA